MTSFLKKSREELNSKHKDTCNIDSDNKKLIVISLVVFTIGLLCIFKIYFFNGDLQIALRWDSRFSTEENGYYNIVIIVTNRSNVVDNKVKIKGYVDKRELFNDYVGNMWRGKPYLMFYGDLTEGEHTIVAVTKDCKQFQKVIEIGKDVRYVYISYGKDEFEKPRIFIEDYDCMILSLHNEGLLSQTTYTLNDITP